MRHHPPFMIIVSAPSGAGKTTLLRHLMAHLGGVRFSVSTTTRQPRAGEKEGVDYFFVDRASFEQRRDRGEFLEWAEVFGNFYGTAQDFVAKTLAEGNDLLLDIDWQGRRQVVERVKRGVVPLEVVTIAILPPSRSSLASRLSGRGSDDPSVIEKRMRAAGEEISHWQEYDYLLVNDDLPRAQEDLVAIVRAERLRKPRMAQGIEQILATFVSQSR
ncbi:MAG: guanylate kinase [Magnetococcales bacterium]|nr:guanylate kinase [Magnetococcales bacterium]MBF0322841.1 guanylate kinase [Magnetococcales bacterium]